MYKLKLYFVKILKKLGLIKVYNFNLTKKLNGVTIKIPFIHGIGLTNFVIQTDWLDDLLQLFIQGEKDVIVDVGVNIGQTLLRVKTIKPGINYLGFEPNSTCCSYTQELIRINNYKGCILQNCALSTNVSNLILEKTAVDDPRASVISSLRPDFFEEKEHVLALDYDSFYIDQNITFIKIDVEGAELEAIKGMKNSISRHKPVITCEVLDSHNSSVLTFTQERATLLSDILRSINYSIIRLETGGLTQHIKSFKKLDTISIKQWTPESYSFNDYLFYPIEKEQEILKKLSTIC